MPISSIFSPGEALHIIKNTEVTFNFTCMTSFGDRVAMIGNISILGHWDVSKAVYLCTSPYTYPMWTIKLDLPRDRVIEYKYILIKGSEQSEGQPSASQK